MSKHHDITKLDATMDEHEEEMTTFGYAVVGTKKVKIFVLLYYKLVVNLIGTSQSSLNQGWLLL